MLHPGRPEQGDSCSTGLELTRHPPQLNRPPASCPGEHRSASRAAWDKAGTCSKLGDCLDRRGTARLPAPEWSESRGTDLCRDLELSLGDVRRQPRHHDAGNPVGLWRAGALETKSPQTVRRRKLSQGMGGSTRHPAGPWGRVHGPPAQPSAQPLLPDSGPASISRRGCPPTTHPPGPLEGKNEDTERLSNFQRSHSKSGVELIQAFLAEPQSWASLSFVPSSREEWESCAVGRGNIWHAFQL
eukprot:XP_028339551.1 uncharacterized protein LOC114484828 [Physeter catodon]